MSAANLLEYFDLDKRTGILVNRLETLVNHRLHLEGLVGSATAVLAAAAFRKLPFHHLLIWQDRESAAYFYNDLENLLGESNYDFHRKQVLFYPASYKKHGGFNNPDGSSILSRTEVLKRLAAGGRKSLIVTYPEALVEKVVGSGYLSRSTLKIKTGDRISPDFVADVLNEYNFERVDFIYQPGQFSIRGGILDVFSYNNDYPYRLEFAGDEVESLRSFSPVDQLSIDRLTHITVVPNVQDPTVREEKVPFISYLPEQTVIWTAGLDFITGRIAQEIEHITGMGQVAGDMPDASSPDNMLIGHEEFLQQIQPFNLVETGRKPVFEEAESISYRMQPQPSFNKNFDLLTDTLAGHTALGITNIILSDNPAQLKRLYHIFEDIRFTRGKTGDFRFETYGLSLHEGFCDDDIRIACFTDHQIFERYHKYMLREGFKSKEAFTLKDMYGLKPGDYVTHIDHGIGRYDGLEKIDVNGREQEAMRLIYQNNDLLYVSIHSLHRIAKYVGKEGKPPVLNRLGSNAWNRLKEKTKKKVKDIAKDLIKLYAERKSAEGFAYTPDTYLQHELEASFIYEDTPDQLKATQDVKKDMEAGYPMDRLVCGDVGFGKTEVAIRAAFKAVTESRQVAVLVPTTILAMQHYSTFSSRLGDFPCRVEYVSRFKSRKELTRIIKELEAGKVDILIGTHRLISEDIKFKDLGLLIIDEEQKFGVAAKERLRKLKVNVDTLTLTATPIPRTLQFSLMGARDLSIINTPPPNRYPIQTELHTFDEGVIRNAIHQEVDRGGQVFIVHNRIQDIYDLAGKIQRYCPSVRIAVAHGQMQGHQLEKIMVDFIEGLYDVLVSTTIIESGLDIPNVNTIIINESQNYGLSDLHQLRGRVGRTNKKAFCYLISPPVSVLTDEARKRLKALEEFSNLGSGFNIAMRDLDIRGAGNILGAEQSGFIAEVGFEMYQKIIDEAILELKETEFKDLYADELKQERPVKECQIETDMAILIPDDYVTSIHERLNLYKELDSIEKEEDLEKFTLNLTDRFGAVPPQTVDLVDTIRLRWLAREIGFDKIALKKEKFTGFFAAGQESPYYQSEMFTNILRYVQRNPSKCRMREAGTRLTLSFFSITTVGAAIAVLKEMTGVG